MSLITDYKVKVPACEKLSLFVMNIINAIHHGLVSRKYTMRAAISFFFAQICYR